jgi:bifunctional non-homologous end joining protein LigD
VAAYAVMAQLPFRKSGNLRPKRRSQLQESSSELGPSAAGDVLLDGEAVVLHQDGHSDFNALRGRTTAAYVGMIVFDVLAVGGEDLRDSPIERRRMILSELLSNAPDGLMLSETIDGHGPGIFKHVCAMGLQGIVRRSGSAQKHRSGRGRNWLKTKNPD